MSYPMASTQGSVLKFKKPQANLQLAGSTSSKLVPPSLANARPAVKFSDDTQRLQQIHSIRKAPAASQAKRVLDLLLKTRRAFTADQINEACYVDVNANKNVFDILTRGNEKVHYDGNRFSYKPKHDIKDKDELLVFIRKNLDGVAVVDLKDSYPTVLEDLQALKAWGRIWLISSSDPKEDIAFPNDPRIVIKVDDNLKQLFRGIELPCDMLDIENDLEKNGTRPATNTAARRSKAEVHGFAPKPNKKEKKRRLTKRTKLTNLHLPELFQHLGFPNS